MSHDDKTIITFRRDAAGSSQSAGQNGGPSISGGFQRPKPGGRGGAAPLQTGPSIAAQPTSVPPVSVPPLPMQSKSGLPPIASAQNSQALNNKPLNNKSPNGQSEVVSIGGTNWSEGGTSTVYINPLVHCANDLIDRMGALRCERELGSSGVVRDVAIFRDETVRQIRDFERRCGQVGIDEESLLYARYVLCTVLDEFATKTPWGGQGGWNNQSLLSQFHDETGGGEKFFQILEHLQTQPATYLNVLELMYIAMSLGFEGKYTLVNRGNVEIENLRDNLFHLMKLQRGEAERDLSPHWKGVSEKRYALMKHVPVWVISAIAGVVLLVLYSGFSYQLNSSQEKILASLQAPIATYLPVDGTTSNSKQAETKSPAVKNSVDDQDGVSPALDN